MTNSQYIDNIIHRNLSHFLIGLLARIPKSVNIYISRFYARQNAGIGKNVQMPRSVAKQLTRNVLIGNNVAISKCNIVALGNFNLTIGNNVIIGDSVSFIMSTHDIHSPEWTHYRNSKGLVIEDYVWICPNAIILPSVTRIGKGAVIGAGSVVSKDVPPMAIIAGNPAKVINTRKCVHSDLCIMSLLGGDIITYIRIWMHRKEIINKKIDARDIQQTYLQ